MPVGILEKSVPGGNWDDMMPNSFAKSRKLEGAMLLALVANNGAPKPSSLKTEKQQQIQTSPAH